MDKLLAAVAATAAIGNIGNVSAKDLRNKTALRVESEISSDPKLADEQRGMGFRRNLRDNSILTFNARHPQLTGTAPRREPSVDSDEDHQGVPEKKSGMIHSDANSEILASHGFQSPYYPNTHTHTCVNDSMYPHSYLYNVGYYFSHSAVECCQIHFSQSVEHCAKAVHYENHPVGEQSSTPEVSSKTAKTTLPWEATSWWQGADLPLPPQEQAPYGYQYGYQSEVDSKTAKTTSRWEATSWWQGGELLPLPPYEYQSEVASKTAKTSLPLEATSWWQGGELSPLPPYEYQSEVASKTAKTTLPYEATSWWQGGALPPPPPEAIYYEGHPVGEQSNPVVGENPSGKKKAILDHYTELEPRSSQHVPYEYQSAKTSKTEEKTSWWQGGEMPSASKTAKTTPTWEATSWWQGGEESKSSKRSKHCKSAKDSKSGKSKSAKGCEGYWGYLPTMPIMPWPTYSPTGMEPPPKIPTMLPQPTVVSFPTYMPTYSPTNGLPTDMPTEMPILPTPMPSAPKPLTLMPSPPKPSSSVAPTIPQTDPSEPTYAPTSGWPTWNPTSATYPPTDSSNGTMPTTERPTLAPSSAGPTVPPLDLLVWGSPLSTSQTGGNILTPLDSGIECIDASAGSRYSIIISSDGTASSTGVIDSMDDYDGHLGIRPQDLKEGQNLIQPIPLVFNDAENGVTSPPRFKKAFAGVEVEEGNIHTMLIDSMGRAWATGSNDKGQLCLGDEIDRLIPEKIPLDRKIVDIAVGGEFTLLLADDGVVYGCGSNALGQLGLGPDLQVVNQPMNIGLSSPAKSISSGKDHSLVVTDDGYYVMGSNEYGQLCTDSGGEPLLVPRALAIDAVVTELKAIKSSTFILYEDGSVNGCGKNNFGQLGNGTEENSFITIVGGESDVVTLLGVGPSAESAFFVHEDGTIWGTGLNDKGQLGVGDTDNRNVPTLVKIEDITTVLLSAAEDHTLAVKEDGIVTTSSPTIPPKTLSPTSAPIQVTAAPTMMGDEFFFWGDPKAIGQDSDGINVERPIFLGEGVLDAAAGSHYSMILLKDGSVVSGGFIASIQDYKGHLGLNSEIVVEGFNALQPVDMVQDGELLSAPLFQRVFAGVESTANTGNIHSILVDRNGRAYATGSNNAGQLCLGDEIDRSIPERIPLENRVIDVAIGGEHTLLLDEFGNVYGCGSNQLGQLGLGNTVGTSSPTVVSSLDKVAHVSAGKDHSLFQAADGIYVTGSNSYGQLCSIMDTPELYVPTKLDLDNGVAENIKQFEAISSSSFILYADGSVNGCGRNNYGQLGDGTNGDAHITTVVIDGAVRILGTGPSAESAFFITEDEEVFGTGLNDKGQLGVGDQQDRNTPARVDFDDKVTVLVFTAAQYHSIALLLADGSTLGPTPSTTADVTTTIPAVTLEPTPTPVETLAPTPLTTVIPVTSFPTKEEGDLPTSEGRVPTYSPTSTSTNSTSSGSTPTYSPTKVSTPFPTYSPTIAEQPDQPSTQSDELYFWGSLQSIGGEGQSTLPEEGDATVVDVSAGSRYSIIILPDGTAQSAGYIDSLDDYHGHLGQGDDVTQGQNSFTPITNVLDESGESISTFFVRAFAGAEQFSSPGSMHSIFLDSDGRVYATGSNSKGQLCLGDFADRSIPQRIVVEGGVTGVAIGNEHTLLLLNDGTVMGCGSNEFGQLGLGEDIKVENIPTKIDIEGVVGISSGLAFSLFKSSEGLFVTGSNSYGQLCTDTEGSDIFSPLPLSLGSSISIDQLASFEALQTSSFILFTDGGVAACGQNNFGQLGNGSYEDVLRTIVTFSDDISTPILRLGVGPSALSAFFVSIDGDIYTTGLNDRGQLGTGDTDNRNTLTKVDISSTGASAISVGQISASNDHTLMRNAEAA